MPNIETFARYDLAKQELIEDFRDAEEKPSLGETECFIIVEEDQEAEQAIFTIPGDSMTPPSSITISCLGKDDILTAPRETLTKIVTGLVYATAFSHLGGE